MFEPEEEGSGVFEVLRVGFSFGLRFDKGERRYWGVRRMSWFVHSWNVVGVGQLPRRGFYA